MNRTQLLGGLLLLILASSATAGKTAADIPLEEFFKTYRVGSLSFSPDETEISFVSDRSGQYQAYVMPVTGGKWRRLVETEDAIGAVTWCPTDRSKIFFLMDRDGNENWRIYRTSPEGREYTCLTPWEGKRSTILGWSHDGHFLYFNTNRRDDRYMDTYRLDMESMEWEVIFENNTTFGVNGISRDDRKLILHEFVSITASNLYEYDVKTREMTPVATQEDGEARYVFADFAPDGRSYYVITDKGSEFRHLRKYDTESGEWETVLTADWDVTYAYFSHRNTYFTTSINEGGISNVRVRNMKTGADLMLPPLPPAEIIPAGFSRSERYLRIVVNADNIPGDQYLFDVQENRLTKLTDLFDNSELSGELLVESELIKYTSFDSLEIPAWIYRPREGAEDRRLPVVFDIHGGPMAQAQPGYDAWTQFLVSRGYVVVMPNVRGSYGYGRTYYLADDGKWGEDPLYDVVYLKYSLGDDPQIDTSKTVIWGGSYGGYMVLAGMTFTPGEFALGLEWVGPSNLFTFMKSIPPYWEPYREYWHREVGDPDDPSDSLRMYRQSPVFFADRIQDPLFIVQGRNDVRVKMAESEQIVEALERNGKSVEYMVFDDEGHGLRKRENRIEAFSRMYEFMESHLSQRTSTD